MPRDDGWNVDAVGGCLLGPIFAVLVLVIIGGLLIATAFIR